MIPWVLTRDSAGIASLEGSVLTSTVRDAEGKVLVEKGTLLSEDAAARLTRGVWETLHLVRREAGELIEREAGDRLAALAAGEGVVVDAPAGGHWALRARARGMLQVNIDALAAINADEALGIYTLFDGQVVEAGETVARAKIVPFVVRSGVLDHAAAIRDRLGAPVAVHPFVPRRVAALVLEGLDDRARARFGASFGEKVAWFGGTLAGITPVTDDPAAVARAFDASDADLVVVAGTRAMDPLDPALQALFLRDATIVRRGVPAHPGSLCWLARDAGRWVVGVPSCGVLSQATIFDLMLTWLFTDRPITAERLSSVGHGGLLGRDMAFRFPPYRSTRDRGAVE